MGVVPLRAAVEGQLSSEHTSAGEDLLRVWRQKSCRQGLETDGRGTDRVWQLRAKKPPREVPPRAVGSSGLQAGRQSHFAGVCGKGARRLSSGSRVALEARLHDRDVGKDQQLLHPHE